MKKNMFSILILIFLLLQSCDGLFSPDKNFAGNISSDADIFNPGHQYQFTVDYQNPPDAYELTWSADDGTLLTNIHGKTVTWKAPLVIGEMEISCRIGNETTEKIFTKKIVTENKPPYLKDIVAEFETRYININVNVYDDDNTVWEITYDFTYDQRLTPDGYGNYVIDNSHNYVFLGFEVPFDENLDIISGNYQITLYITDLVSQIEKTFVVFVPPRNNDESGGDDEN